MNFGEVSTVPQAAKLVARCRRSNRFWYRWLERGDTSPTEADAVFKDATLRSRLSAPLQRLKKPASGASSSLAPLGGTGASDPELPAPAKELARHAAEEFGVAIDVAEDLVRLYADEKLGGLAVNLYQGSKYDLLDLSKTSSLDALGRLLHAEKCEALQVIACILRTAQDDGSDGHVYSAQCRELAHGLLRDGLSEHLWQLFQEVSQRPASKLGRAEVLSLVREGLELQICILECLALAHYDPDLYMPVPEQLYQMADLFFRQRFLGSLPAAARDAGYPWLLDDAQLCVQARCVGDLCLALLLEGFALADCVPGVLQHGQRHPLLESRDYVRQLHGQFSSAWAQKCEEAVSGRASPIGTHCAGMASLTILGWAALIGWAHKSGLPEANELNLEKITHSKVFTSPSLVENATNEILSRGFLAKDAPRRDHGVFRKVLSHLAGAVASSFKLQIAVPGIQVAMSRLMEAAYLVEAEMCKDFWTVDCPRRCGGYFVLREWLSGFPGSLGMLLDLIGGLAGSREHPQAAAAAVRLLQAPLQTLLLPHHMVPLVHRPSQSASTPNEVMLSHPVYLEELALCSLGLAVPEWHVPLCTVLSPESDVEWDAAAEGPMAGNMRVRKVCWDLRGKDRRGRGLSSVWRLALAAWDASLEALGCIRLPAAPGMSEPERGGARGSKDTAAKLLPCVLRCVCHLLIANPASYVDLCRGLPSDRPLASSSAQDAYALPNDGSGLAARLLASLFACTSKSLGGPLGLEMLPMILRALGACMSAPGVPGEGVAPVPPYAMILGLLQGDVPQRFYVGDAGAVVNLLTAALDAEREKGSYPSTLAALGFIEALIEACPAELLVLPWRAHAAVPQLSKATQRQTSDAGTSGHCTPVAAAGQLLPDGSAESSSETQPQAVETLGVLLDFAFGHCLARCSMWKCGSQSDRWQLALACIRIATALLPAMECFNWPSQPGLTMHDPKTADQEAATTFQPSPDRAGELVMRVIANLRSLQVRVLRSWSEASFIPTLFQLLSCDIGFQHPSGQGASHFIGFVSPALEDTLGSGPCPVDSSSVYWAEPVSGCKVVVGALECLHGLVTLVLHPEGAAPHYASLAQHLLEASIAREPRSKVFGWIGAKGSSGEAIAPVPHRADFVQSLYAYTCGEDAAAARWAASTLASFVVLWSHVDLLQGPGESGRAALSGHPVSDLQRKPLLAAFLSIPPRPTDVVLSDIQEGATGASRTDASQPVLLSSHLARHLLGVIKNADKDGAFRCSCADFVRIALTAQPGLFLDGAGELLQEAADAAGQALADVIVAASGSGGSTSDSTTGELLMVLLALLDNLAAVNSSVVVKSFSKTAGQLPAQRQRYPTIWHLLNALVSEILRPWAQGTGSVWPQQSSTPEPFLAVAAIFRLAERGCEAADDILKETPEAHAALVELLACLLGPSGMELWLRPARTQPEATGSEDYDMMSHPYGAAGSHAEAWAPLKILQEGRISTDRFHGLLAKYQLRSEMLGPPLGSAAARHSLSGAHRRGGDRNVVAEMGLQQAFAGRNAALQAYGFSNLAGALTSAYGGRCSIPTPFRWWADLCELACGAAVEVSAPGRGPLPLWRSLKADADAGSLTSGSWSSDAYVVGTPLHIHGPSVRLVAACICALRGENVGVVEDLVSLVGECKPLANAQAGFSSRVLAVEAFDALVGAASRQAHGGKAPQVQSVGDSLANKVSELLTPLASSVIHHLHCALGHLDLLADHAAFFARLVRLASRLLAMPPHVSALLSPSHVMTPFHNVRGLLSSKCPICEEVLKDPVRTHCGHHFCGACLTKWLKESPMGNCPLCRSSLGDRSFVSVMAAESFSPKLILESETPLGLAVVRQLTSTLQATGARLQLTEDLPPRSQALVTGAAFCSGHADVAFASVSLLMLLVPALRRAGPRSSEAIGARTNENSFETLTLLTELLQVVAGLLDCISASEQREAVSKARMLSAEEGIGGVATMAVDEGGRAIMTSAGPAGGSKAPELAPTGLLADGRAPKVLLQSPEDAMTRCTDETQERALDHVLRSGLTGLLLALAERVVTALRDREGVPDLGSQGPKRTLGNHSLAVLQRVLLPRILSCSCAVFSPSLDRHRLPSSLVAIGARPALTAPVWDRAVEAAWACQLDAVLSVLLTVAESTAGAVMLAEQRVFSLLAYCKLLHVAVLPVDSSDGQFPAAYAWPSHFGHIYRKKQKAWRRPLHESWCRALLLVATLLSSAPQLASEATVFLDQFTPRLQYVFRKGMQTGHMAVLEEATMACRILALVSHRVGLAEYLLGDAVPQALAFLAGSCFGEISSASEVFMPVSVAERLGAQLVPEAEAAPAVVPSVFHQRVQYLSLDLVRSILLALLRVTSSPTWLSNVATWASNPSWSTSATQASFSRGWPSTPSVLGLNSQMGNGVGLAHPEGNSANGPQNLYSRAMEVSLKIAWHMVSTLDALRGHRSALILVSAPNAAGEDKTWIPLSLAISVLEPHETHGTSTPSSAAGSASPSGLARGLTPPSTPRSPGRLTPLLGPRSPKRPVHAHREEVTKSLRYRHMALRSDSWFGRQLTLGIIPEYTSVADFRLMCSSILEMACTLVCHFCMATRANISTGSDRSSPASAVLDKVLSFFEEIREPQSSRHPGIEPHIAEYVRKLDAALKAEQDFGDSGGNILQPDDAGRPSGPLHQSLGGESFGPSNFLTAVGSAGPSSSGHGFRAMSA